jgi:hypothetical protein
LGFLDYFVCTTTHLTRLERKDFINFLDKKDFLYGSNEENKESNKANRDKLSLDAHNCIYYNHRLISSFL